jgi:hypothetical protein
VIAVVGSRHDTVATSIVGALPGAALCSADDLTRPGWLWPVESPERACWVIDGATVPDADVTGVLVRRTYVYPEELVTTHRDDREYLAAEATAFLIFVLSRTGAVVINEVGDGALGDDAIRPERWMRVAAGMGIQVRPLRLRPGQRLRRPARTATVEVVGREAFGGAAPRLRKAATHLAGALGLTYAACVFDGRGALVSVSTMKPPGAEATAALGRLLGTGGGR